jgi:dCMP deaminase
MKPLGIESVGSVAYDYMKRALWHAKTSPDTSTKNGAVLVCRDGTAIYGTNGIPNGVKITDERLNERPLKYQCIHHAEDHCILQAAKMGISTQNSIMYCPWACCNKCATSIIDAGVARLVVIEKLVQMSSFRDWNVDFSFEMLREAGVQIFGFTSDVDFDETILIGKKLIGV